MDIRQLEKRCDREIQAVCNKYTGDKLTKEYIRVFEHYSLLIAVAKAEEPPIADLEGYGKFLEKLALKSIKTEATILQAKENEMKSLIGYQRLETDLEVMRINEESRSTP